MAAVTTANTGFVFREPAEKSREYVQRDSVSVSPSYTRSYGFVMDHGKGSDVWDVDGNKYLDFAAGIAANEDSHPASLGQWRVSHSRIRLTLESPT